MQNDMYTKVNIELLILNDKQTNKPLMQLPVMESITKGSPIELRVIFTTPEGAAYITPADEGKPIRAHLVGFAIPSKSGKS
jgi:hypothetical protein